MENSGLKKQNIQYKKNYCNKCTICKVKATSGHQAADCVISVFFRHILQNNKAFLKKMDPSLINPLMMEFGLHVKETPPAKYSCSFKQCSRQLKNCLSLLGIVITFINGPQ